MKAPIRVLIAEDSLTQRAVLRHTLSQDPGITVVGEAEDGEVAVERALALQPDVVTMDVVMPRTDGLSAIVRIMEKHPCRIIVVASITRADEMTLSFRALQAGALQLVAKTRPGDEHAAWGRKLRQMVHLMSEVPVVTRRRIPTGPQPIITDDPIARPLMIGIVASTGGPPAVCALLSALPATLDVPVLVAQHMADGFTPGLQRWLATFTPLKVVIATPGMPVSAGSVYLPPDNHHLELGPRGRLVVTRASEDEVAPSGDRLLSSIAREMGASSAGVVLTGMGEDGARGLLAMRKLGALTLVQDDKSCVVAGMPRAARHMGAAQMVLTVPEIAQELKRRCDGVAT